MTANTTPTDARTDRQKTEMAQWWAEEQTEYRDANGYTIVDEDAQRVIVADHTGHEINEWASQFDVDREGLRATFRAAHQPRRSRTVTPSCSTNSKTEPKRGTGPRRRGTARPRPDDGRALKP